MKGFLSDQKTAELTSDVVSLIETGILVVDEDPAFQLGLKTFLKEYVGFEKVFTARNGKEAIDMIKREPSIELLTVDYHMPVMDGMKMLAQLQENSTRPLGVTMITSFPSDQLKIEFAARKTPKLLTNHFLAKPVEFEKLEPVILQSYEDLRRAKLNAVKEPRESQAIVNRGGTTTSQSELMARLDFLTEKLESQNKVLMKLQLTSIVSFWLDILKLLLVAGILLFVWQSGWLKMIGEKVRQQSVPFVEAIKLPVAPPISSHPPETSNIFKTPQPD